MNTLYIYNYLAHARRDLWKVLEAVPDEALTGSLGENASFPCLKDLLFHTITCEDGWLNMDILRQEPVLRQFEMLDNHEVEAVCQVPLEILLNYWQAVEKKTLTYLKTLDDAELKRVMTPHDDPDWHLVVEQVLWHVMIHEMRHTAQTVVLLRSQGIKPPSLDLLFYLSELGGEETRESA